jgi:hypothetical protein
MWGRIGSAPGQTPHRTRRVGEPAWEQQARGKPLNADFETLFHDVLAPFDLLPADSSVQRVQDELIGQMAELLGVERSARNQGLPR